MNRRSFMRWLIALAAPVVLPTQVVSQERGAQGARPPSSPLHFRTLREAVETGDRVTVAHFINGSPASVTQASLRDRVTALRLLAHGTVDASEMTARIAQSRGVLMSVAQCQDLERACFQLMQAAHGNPQELQAYFDGVGGRTWAQTNLLRLNNQQLRQSVAQGLQSLQGALGTQGMQQPQTPEH